MKMPEDLKAKLALVETARHLRRERTQHEATKTTLDDAWEKLDQLRRNITAAPHGPECATWAGDLCERAYPCDCWKKEIAL